MIAMAFLANLLLRVVDDLKRPNVNIDAQPFSR